MSRQLLYLTQNQLIAYSRHQGQISVGHVFSNDEAGWGAFAQYLIETPPSLIYILVDLIEENFQHETLPHVQGKAKQRLLRRRLDQLYHDTSYRHATFLGREKTGRKDDLVLMSALTNESLLKPWIDAILQQKAALAGIYSLPFLSDVLVKKLGLLYDHLLLVTYHSCGIRQSYLQRGTLRFSRLTPLSTNDAGAIAEISEAETAKTHQFLVASRFQPRGEQMHVAIIAHDENLQQLQSVCKDTETLTYHFFSLEDASRKLKTGNKTPLAVSEPLFLTLLACSTPRQNYATPEQTQFFKLWKIRFALYGLSALSLILSLGWIVSDSLKTIEYQAQSKKLASEIRTVQAKYDNVIRTLPHTETSPQNMKSAAIIEKTLNRNVPRKFFSIISRALDTLPQISIDQLQWQVIENADTSAPSNHPPPSTDTTESSPVALPGILQKPHEMVLIEGSITSSGDNYRTAVETVQRFVDALGKNKNVKVEIARPPVNIVSTSKLEGKASGDTREIESRFSLKLTLAPET